MYDVRDETFFDQVHYDILDETNFDQVHQQQTLRIHNKTWTSLNTGT